ncbi:MAG TPA: response regulator [Stellaceae bacterium]|nr:response regulator [Stellaceae bacterium]
MGSPLRLLIVDDDSRICDFARRVAEGAGYEVATASNHDDFLRAYEALDPSVILLDLVMPKVDGIGVLEILAERQSRAKILIMSGYHPELLKSGSRLGHGYELAMRGTLQKPFGVAELREALRSIAEEEEEDS